MQKMVGCHYFWFFFQNINSILHFFLSILVPLCLQKIIQKITTIFKEIKKFLLQLYDKSDNKVTLVKLGEILCMQNHGCLQACLNVYLVITILTSFCCSINTLA